MAADSVLRMLLRLLGGGCLVAIVPFAMPAEWISAAPAALGMGAFPAQPIAEYMARFSSAMAAFHGGLALGLSTDVRRFAPAIVDLALATWASSDARFLIGRKLRMPLIWLAFDLASCWCLCVPIAFRAPKILFEPRVRIERAADAESAVIVWTGSTARMVNVQSNVPIERVGPREPG